VSLHAFRRPPQPFEAADQCRRSVELAAVDVMTRKTRFLTANADTVDYIMIVDLKVG